MSGCQYFRSGDFDGKKVDIKCINKENIWHPNRQNVISFNHLGLNPRNKDNPFAASIRTKKRDRLSSRLTSEQQSITMIELYISLQTY